MPALECPNCAASVDVDQRFSHMAVCGSCRSVVTFGEEAAAIRGSLSLLPPSRSQLFVGANGSVEGMDFVVLGRVRYGYERGFWDEWYLQCGDGDTAWISEDPEGLVYERLVDGGNEALSYEPLEPGREIEIEGISYAVRERDVAHCQGGAGQLPFVVVQDEETPFADLEGPDGAVGSVEFGEEGARIFVGRSLKASDLNLTVTRQEIGMEDIPLAAKTAGGRAQLTILAGKKRAINCSNCAGGMEVDVESGVPSRIKCPYCGSVEEIAPTQVSCPNCQTSVPLRSGSEAASATCGECMSLINLRTSTPSVLSTLARPEGLTSPISLGSTFSWEGTDYEVIGWIRNTGEDDGEAFFWDEFLLFSESGGYMWLELSDGHASLGKRITDGPALASPSEAGLYIPYDGMVFRVAETGQGRVHWVEGELPWVAKTGDAFTYVDAARAPFRIGGEWSKTECEWFISEYIGRAEVIACLSSEPTLEPISGVAPHQPYPRGATHTAIFALIFFVLGLVATMLLSGQQSTVAGPFSFGGKSGIHTPAGSESQEFSVPEPGEYEMEVKAIGLTDAWAYVRGSFVTSSGEVSAEFSSQLQQYPELPGHGGRSKNTDSFRVVFKNSGSHRLKIRGEAASVFMKSGPKLSATSGRKCSPKVGDRVVFQGIIKSDWKLGTVVKVKSKVSYDVRDAGGKEQMVWHSKVRCATKAETNPSTTVATARPKIRVELREPAMSSGGFIGFLVFAGGLFAVLLFHRWGFHQRQTSSGGSSWGNLDNDWGDDD